jgi:hypothetical protein
MIEAIIATPAPLFTLGSSDEKVCCYVVVVVVVVVTAERVLPNELSILSLHPPEHPPPPQSALVSRHVLQYWLYGRLLLVSAMVNVNVGSPMLFEETRQRCVMHIMDLQSAPLGISMICSPR